MKTIEQLEHLLFDELSKHVESLKAVGKSDYYNEVLGDTSFLLARLLESLLKKECEDWDITKWIDDSLITKFKIENNLLNLWGIMIWGRENTTEQWTDPFYFEVELSKDGFESFSFLLGDLKNREVSYEEFRRNQNYWSAKDRNWKYKVKQQ